MRLLVLGLLSILALDARADGLLAGAAEGHLDFSIGHPLAGYTGRWTLFGFDPADERAFIFARNFAPSTGVHTRPVVKALALTAGGETVVIAKTDLIFADALLLRSVEDRAGELASEPLRGRIVLSTSHSHNSPGRFTQNTALMAGADTYDEATLRRFAESIAQVVARALAERVPARLGMGVDPAFDPLGVDRIFRDRRSENDHLAPDGRFFFEADGVTVDLDAPGARGPGKDAALTLLRVDRQDGRPLAVVVHYGIHGTALGDEVFPLDAAHPDEANLWVSGEAATAVEWKLEESFRRPVVVMHLQGAAGDVSPAGDDQGYRKFARLELIAERARERSHALWKRTATAHAGVSLRVATRQVGQDFEAVRVERGGTVDWHYVPNPDGVYDGNILTFEDFAFDSSAALCGGSSLDLLAGGVVELTPAERAQVEDDPTSPAFGRGLAYGSCTPVDEPTFQLLGGLLDPTFDPDRDIPLPETLSSVVSALLLDGVPVVDDTGAAGAASVLVAAAPGEPTSYWSERLVERARSELGVSRALVVGYAQDHEGYLLLPEDWLSGGATEVQINVWGPLQGEYLLERTLETAAALVAGPVDPDPGPLAPPPDVVPLAPVEPRETPLAGTVLGQPPERVERLDTANVEWIGGDPAVDQPRVVLQHRSQLGFRSGFRSGLRAWRDVRLPSGRALDDANHRIVVAYTPDPVAARQPNIQRDLYRAYYQVVRDTPDLAWVAGMPLGEYRFRIEGRRAVAGGDIVPYEAVSDSFWVQPLALEIRDLSVSWLGVRGQVVLPPREGYRLLSDRVPAGEPIPVANALVYLPGSWLFGLGFTDADGRFAVFRFGGGAEVLAWDLFWNRGSAPLAP